MIVSVDEHGSGLPGPALQPATALAVMGALAARMPGFAVGRDCDGAWFAARLADGARFFAAGPAELYAEYQARWAASAPANAPVSAAAEAEAAAEPDRSGRIVPWVVGALAAALTALLALAW